MNNCVLRHVFPNWISLPHTMTFFNGGGWGETVQLNKIEAFSQRKL